ncbi:MAG: hypothetical protein ABI690_08995 [Chloroflexota bacterium]
MIPERYSHHPVTPSDVLMSCECGCGGLYPLSQMVQRPTRFHYHGTEMIYRLHIDPIPDGKTQPRRSNWKRALRLI